MSPGAGMRGSICSLRLKPQQAPICVTCPVPRGNAGSSPLVSTDFGLLSGSLHISLLPHHCLQSARAEAGTHCSRWGRWKEQGPWRRGDVSWNLSSAAYRVLLGRVFSLAGPELLLRKAGRCRENVRALAACLHGAWHRGGISKW